MAVEFDENGIAINDGNITVYYYRESNKEYISSSEMFINVGLSLPPCSTLINPGEQVPGHAFVWSSGVWMSVEDHRGETVYNLTTGNPVLISDLGPYPENTSTTRPLPSNSDLRKSALSEILSVYQYDIQTMNMAWLAASVSGGTSEETKKSNIIAQISSRKARYSQDVSAVIAQYPV